MGERRCAREHLLPLPLLPRATAPLAYRAYLPGLRASAGDERHQPALYLFRPLSTYGVPVRSALPPPPAAPLSPAGGRAERDLRNLRALHIKADERHPECRQVAVQPET